MSNALRFGPLHKARFVERPNRFLVRCQVPGAGAIEAFLPNPGRLRELLLPRSTLYLSKASAQAGARATRRKTRYTVLAAERDGAPILVDTHLANAVVKRLLEQKRIPTLEHAVVVGTEVPVGDSRFDFLLREDGREFLMEVKSCTLYGNEVAMFPDAVTERGRRHLLELAKLSRKGAPAALVFLVHAPKVRWFMPNYHTDLAFSQTLLEVRKRMRILPVSVGWQREGRLSISLAPEVKLLTIPWDYVRREAKDRGSYLLLLTLRKHKRIDIGRLGRIAFRKGHYVYVGSAMRHLAARVARHLRTRKRLHWHIDYLLQAADRVIPLPIRSSLRLECRIARALACTLASGPKGFGSSDCDCPTHLFFDRSHPIRSQPFRALIENFRMKPPS